MSTKIKQITKNWLELNKQVYKPRNDKQLKKLIEFLDELLDEVGASTTHPLLGLIDLVSHYIEKYEQETIAAPEVSGVEMLKFLMEANNLRQVDLATELGSQGIVSEILSGKRQLNINQIKALAKRFNVSAATFIDVETDTPRKTKVS